MHGTVNIKKPFEKPRLRRKDSMKLLTVQARPFTVCLECVFGLNESSGWSAVFFKRARRRVLEQDSRESILPNLVGVRWRLAPRATRHLSLLQTFTNVSQCEVCRACCFHVRSSYTSFVWSAVIMSVQVKSHMSIWLPVTWVISKPASFVNRVDF